MNDPGPDGSHSNGRLFNGLPVPLVATGLNFHVDAPLNLTADRTNILDDAFNEWLSVGSPRRRPYSWSNCARTDTSAIRSFDVRGRHHVRAIERTRADPAVGQNSRPIAKKRAASERPAGPDDGEPLRARKLCAFVKPMQREPKSAGDPGIHRRRADDYVCEVSNQDSG